MVKKIPRKPSYTQIRWLCQIIVALIVLMLPVTNTLRLVLAFLFALIVAIMLLAYRISGVAPWQLELLKSPNHRWHFWNPYFIRSAVSDY
jgi:4-hydroxybenzoate polyprenyltransferase